MLDVPPTRTLRSWAGIAPVARLRPRECALLLIDFQREYLDGRLPLDGVQAAVARARALMELADAAGIPVFHIHHVAPSAAAALFAPDTPAVLPIAGLAPAAHHRSLKKRMPSAFHGTELDALLCAGRIDTLVVAGLMTHMCVDSTTRDAVHRGYRVVVVGDACASRALPGGTDGETQHRASLAALADRFADVVDLQGCAALLAAGGQDAGS